jgi:dynein heavy chain
MLIGDGKLRYDSCDVSGGNAMLICVGASGKQSLPKLTAYICGYESVLLSVSSSLKVEDLKEQIRSMYKQAARSTFGTRVCPR